MAKGDAGTVMTDMGLKRLENKIGRIYDGAKSDIEKTISEYWADFAAKDEQMAQRLDAGEIDHDYYKQWRLNQVGRGKRYEAMRDKLADRLYNANKVANTYVNDATPGIYSLNWNYSAYVIDGIHKGADLILYDEQTVKRLIRKNPNLMPRYPKERAIDRGIDLAYSKKVITNTITRSILTGRPLKQMKEELMSTIIGMSQTSALRAARTAFTGAQNAGRLACMESASENGIDVQKQWLSGYDNRVRESHLEANAQIKPIDEPFEVGDEELMFPADPDGKPSEVYNCRCTLIYVVDGMSVLDPQFNSGTTEDFKNWMQKKGEEPEPVPVPSKYNPLDDCKTVEDVEDLFRSKDWFRRTPQGARTDAKLSLAGIDLRSAKEVYSAYDRTFEKFPSLKNWMHPPYIDPSAGNGTYANCQLVIGRVGLNPGYFKDYSILEKGYNSDLKLNWHPQGTTPSSIIIHELGHAMDGFLTFTGVYDISGTKGYASKGMRKEVAKLTKTKIKDMGKHVSDYAMQSPEEWFAECFAEYMDSPNPRPVAKALGEMIEELLNTKKGKKK